ncbi:hypothetical protein TWF730_001878 [Orbilia blumenaviensis]|uniref:Uncharacterized protein n=1 Tax=Orbilia blumenaviensis TaxID=1796055 RepID=A0AAV9UEL5_9PEZI
MLTNQVLLFKDTYNSIISRRRERRISENRYEELKRGAEKILARICMERAMEWLEEWMETKNNGKLAVRLRKMRDKIDDVDNSYDEQGCKIWQKVIERAPAIDDLIELILGEDVNPNIPDAIAEQLEMFKELDRLP